MIEVDEAYDKDCNQPIYRLQEAVERQKMSKRSLFGCKSNTFKAKVHTYLRFYLYFCRNIWKFYQILNIRQWNSQ